MNAKTNKTASLHIARLPINSEVISLVRKCDNTTDSLALQSRYFS